MRFPSGWTWLVPLLLFATSSTADLEAEQMLLEKTTNAFARLEASIAAAELRWKESIVGRILGRDGRPRAEADVLAPLVQARSALEAGRTKAVTAFEDARAGRIAPLRLAALLDEAFETAVVRVWEADLAEARLGVEICQQDATQAIAPLASDWEAVVRAAGSEPGLSAAQQAARIEAAARPIEALENSVREEIDQAVEQVARRLLIARQDGSDLVRARAEDARAGKRAGVPERLSALVEAEFESSDDPDAPGARSSLDAFLSVAEVRVPSVVRREDRGAIGLAKWVARFKGRRVESEFPDNRLAPAIPLPPRIWATVVVGRPDDYPWAGLPFCVPKKDAAGGTRAWLLFVLGTSLPAEGTPVEGDASDVKELRYTVIGSARRASAAAPEDEWLRRGYEKVLRDAPYPESMALAGMEARLVATSVPPGLPAAWHRFTIGEAAGTWLLDPGTYTGSLEFVRGVPEAADMWDAPAEAFVLDTLRVEVRADQGSAAPEILVAIARNENAVSFGGETVLTAKAVPGHPNTWRTDPLLLVQPGREAAAGAGPGTLLLPCAPGDTLTAVVVDRLFQVVPSDRVSVWMSPASVKYADGTTSLWKDALKEVAGLWDLEVHDWDKLSEEQVSSLWVAYVNHEIRPGVRGPNVYRMPITAADHAAMLLLRREFVAAAREMKEALTRIRRDPALLPAYREQLRMALRGVHDRYAHPLYGMFVVPPEGWRDPGKYYLLYAVDPFWLAQAFPPGTTREAKERWSLQTISRSIDDQLGWLTRAEQQALALDAKDLDGLLKLTGKGFEPIVERVRPRLLRLAEREGPGGAKVLRWEADENARVTLNQIAARLFEYQSAKQAGTEERDATLALLSVAALHPAALGVRVLLVASSVASTAAAAYDLELHEAAKEDLEFSKNAALLLGWDRYHAAKEAVGTDWIPYGSLFLSVVGLRFDISDLARGVRLSAAYRDAPAVIAKVERGGAKAMAALTWDETRAFYIVLEDSRVAAAEAKALTGVQKVALEAAENVAAERAGLDALEVMEDVRLGTTTMWQAPDLPGSAVGDSARGTDAAAMLDKLQREHPGMPLPHTTYRPPEGDKTLFLGKIRGVGAFAAVYDLLNAKGKPTGKVLKIVEPIADGWDPSTIDQLAARLRRSTDILAEFAPSRTPRPLQPIPQLRTTHIERVGKYVYVFQEAIPEGAYLARKVDGIVVFSPEELRAFVVLHRKMANAKLLWLDGHLGNVYFFTDEFGHMTAGVLDPDMVIREGEAVANVHLAQRVIHYENACSVETGVLSMETVDDDFAVLYGPRGSFEPDANTVPSWTAEQWAARFLEHKGLVKYEREPLSVVASTGRRGKFVDGRASVKMIQDYFDLDANATYGSRALRRRRASARHRPRALCPPLRAAA